MRSIFKIKPLILACLLGVFASAPARADIATLLSALVLGSAVLNGIDDGPSDLSKSQPSSQMAQSFRALSKAERRAIQRRLNELGFYNRTVDGLWGTGTLSALRRYAKSRGLRLQVNSSSDARRVLNQLRGRSAPAVNRTQKTTTGADAVAIDPAGLSRSRIKDVQLWLSANGYDAGPIDGVFGGQSQDAAQRYLVGKGLSATNVSLDELYAMLDGSLDTLLSGPKISTSAFSDYQDLGERELGVELARRAYFADASLLEDEGALRHWVEQEYPRERYATGQALANNLTRDFYDGTPDEQQSAAGILQRLVLANLTDEPIKFSVRDKVVLQPVNFVPSRGIPIHDLRLGRENLLPYDVAVRLVPIVPAKASARFFNDAGIDIGHLPVDQARANAIQALLRSNTDHAFEMVSFVSLNSLSSAPLNADGKPMFEADASFDGFALVLKPTSANAQTSETILHQWVSPNQPKTWGRGTAASPYNDPSISAVRNTF